MYEINGTPYLSADEVRSVTMGPNDVGCPCCGDPMHYSLVTCWTCYRLSNRLTVGTWPEEQGGGTWELTQEALDRYDAARMERLSPESIQLRENGVHEYHEDDRTLVFRSMGGQTWYGAVKKDTGIRVTAWGVDAETVLADVRGGI